MNAAVIPQWAEGAATTPREADQRCALHGCWQVLGQLEAVVCGPLAAQRGPYERLAQVVTAVNELRRVLTEVGE